MNKNDLQKFQKKIQLDSLSGISSGCWNWTDHLDKDGYGRLRLGKNRFLCICRMDKTNNF